MQGGGQGNLLMLNRFWNNRIVMVVFFMTPASFFLLYFLAYPLGKSVWFSLTDATLGGSGHWVGLSNYFDLFQNPIVRLVIFNTVFYTVVATSLKFVFGMSLALLLNHRGIPFLRFVRSVILLPWIVPTALSALVFWWLYDPQFSVISWTLVHLGLTDHYIDFLGQVWNARFSVIAMNVWRGVPFIAIMLLAGLQTVPPNLYEAAAIDGVNAWQRFRHITLPLLRPFIAVVMAFDVMMTFTDFQLVWVLTRGGPRNATHLMTTLTYVLGINGGQLGLASALAILMVPFLMAIILVAYFWVGSPRWQRV